MKYISTGNTSTVSIREATLKCFAPDGGLYLPERLPIIPRALFNNIAEMSLTEIAYVVTNTLLGDEVESWKLKSVVETTFNFPIPLKTLHDHTSVLELFHGPTLAFKDISARFMALAMNIEKISAAQPMTILTATTGNTGGAIANAFAGMKNARVLVLYPRGAMSRSQLAQFTTIGRNVYPFEVNGSISQCKRMVREACEDSELAETTMPVCVNTQNIIRLLPQIVYFFYAYAQLKKAGCDADGFTVALPCGNLSNLTSAIIAKRMGLPIKHIVGGCNANDDFVRVIRGELNPDKVNVNSRQTIANAMDSGYPTNLHRVLFLYKNNLDALRADIDVYSLNDEEIAQTVINCLDSYGYLCDPHTAVALGALQKSGTNNTSVVLATAHPAKSLDTMTEITGRAVELPLQLTRFMSKQTASAKLPPTYAALKKYILNLNQ